MIFHAENQCNTFRTFNLSPKEDIKRPRRLLARISKVSQFMAVREAWNESKVMPDISLTTVKRYLRESNLYGRVAVKFATFNTSQIQKRYQWCKEYSGFSAADWSKVIFSYKCCIERHSSSCTFARRPKNSRFQ